MKNEIKNTIKKGNHSIKNSKKIVTKSYFTLN